MLLKITLAIVKHNEDCVVLKFPSTQFVFSEKSKAETKENQSFRPPSCLLLPAEPKRGGEKPRLSKKTNIHVLVEFGLHLLCLCLKRGRLVATEELHCRLVDLFIALLSDSLYSKHIRVSLCDVDWWTRLLPSCQNLCILNTSG
jgi:U3 small nucleolar RNA-associated protein 20